MTEEREDPTPEHDILDNGPQDRPDEGPQDRRAGCLVSALVSVLILALAGGLLWWIFRSEPEAKRTGASRESAMLVDVVEVERGDYRPRIIAMGTVEPSRDIVLSPRVEGMITTVHAPFQPGAFVPEGEVLLEIDPADYANSLRQRESDLKRAQAALTLELGRRQAAAQGFELLEREVAEKDRSLVLREPQLETARADVEAAEAMVGQARLDLERTRIRAPFDAHVLDREANTGSQVSPGDSLGRLVGVEEYWIEATVPLAQIPWLEFADEDGEGTKVSIRNRSAWSPGEKRAGRLLTLVGALDERTRLARVIVSVSDPLGVLDPGAEKPRLIVGTFVETEMAARMLENVVRLDRAHLHQDDTVRLMRDGKLAIRTVGVAFRDAEHAYIRDGLETGDLVVTTKLSTVVEGAGLRRTSAEKEAKPDFEEGDREASPDGSL